MPSHRPGTVDYSKFDAIECSDSEDDETAQWQRTSNRPADRTKKRLATTDGSQQDGGSVSNNDSLKDEKSPNCVTLHPDDDRRGLHPVYLEDPLHFTPFENPEYSATFGEPIRFRWGLPNEYEAEGIPEDQKEDFLQEVRSREMEKQLIYGVGAMDTPQKQFVSILAKRKRVSLKRERERRRVKYGGQEDPRDLVLHVYLANRSNGMKPLNPKIYRSVKVSSLLKLSVLADKVLTPLMGWVRNYHSYYFCDLWDGAIWCPQEHGANEAVHFLQICAGDSLSPSETTVGELLRKVGDKIAWVYDIGDHFTHIVEVEKIIKGPEASGRCIVLDGKMRCPPEDCGGCEVYQEKLDLYYESLQHPYDDKAQRDRARAFYEFRRSLNVLGRFNPDEFDLEHTSTAVSNALRSRASSLKEPKTFVGMGNNNIFGLDIPISKVGFNASLPRHCKPGQIIQETPFTTDRNEMELIMSEVVNLGADERSEAICVCGNPSKLASCSRCSCIWYCSKSCQLDDWVVHKKECKVFKRQLEETLSSEPVRMPLIKPKSRDEKLRFVVGDKVECQVGDNDFRKGRIIATDYREPHWPLSRETVPYQVLVDGEALIWAPVDDDFFVRQLPAQTKPKSKKKEPK